MKQATMKQATIRIPTPLRSYTGGAADVSVEGETVGQALEQLRLHDGLLDQVLDDEGEVRRFVNIYLGDRNIDSLDGLATPLGDDAVIAIVPAVAGGER